MGRFAAVMKSVLRAMSNAPRWVWRQCRETGKLVLEGMIMPIDLVMGTAGVAKIEKDPDATAEQNSDWERAAVVRVVKTVATQILGGEVNDKDLRMLPERVIRWLSVLDRKQLARVACATDYAVQDHVERRGKGIEGVLPFTKSAIDARAEELAKQELQAREERRERKARMEESERMMREIEDRRERMNARDAELEELGFPRPGYAV